MSNCVICNKTATVGVRGTIEKQYIYTCSVHAGMLQMILDTLNVNSSVKWRPLYEKPNASKVKKSG